ncbi:uncharacterized protein BcabD6B2_21880 [Babesia caballi]|uniref:Uncharacterized protein n=1 Tax=Babesia caballi TaxID=5871 RepID=A0AAV4LRZ7_BABCB|nr:hypothetical protein BcabD6B2_21880 [Babesia caballi]
MHVPPTRLEEGRPAADAGPAQREQHGAQGPARLGGGKEVAQLLREHPRRQRVVGVQRSLGDAQRKLQRRVDAVHERLDAVGFRAVSRRRGAAQAVGDDEGRAQRAERGGVRGQHVLHPHLLVADQPAEDHALGLVARVGARQEHVPPRRHQRAGAVGVRGGGLRFARQTRRAHRHLVHQALHDGGLDDLLGAAAGGLQRRAPVGLEEPGRGPQRRPQRPVQLLRLLERLAQQPLVHAVFAAERRGAGLGRLGVPAAEPHEQLHVAAQRREGPPVGVVAGHPGGDQVGGAEGERGDDAAGGAQRLGAGAFGEHAVEHLAEAGVERQQREVLPQLRDARGAQPLQHLVGRPVGVKWRNLEGARGYFVVRAEALRRRLGRGLDGAQHCQGPQRRPDVLRRRPRQEREVEWVGDVDRREQQDGRLEVAVGDFDWRVVLEQRLVDAAGVLAVAVAPPHSARSARSLVG